MVDKVATKIIKCFRNNGKVLICGNGGSATMAEHFAGEFIGKFEMERAPLPAISLFGLASITSIGNDYGYEYIFTRQIEALGQPGDVLITLSTSGKSKNILNAIKQAKSQAMVVIDIPREGKTTAKIQEYQLKFIHDVARKVERILA
jgi:D-sedoheptulose 7-phosphate isomerase